MTLIIILIHRPCEWAAIRNVHATPAADDALTGVTNSWWFPNCMSTTDSWTAAAFTNGPATAIFNQSQLLTWKMEKFSTLSGDDTRKGKIQFCFWRLFYFGGLTCIYAIGHQADTTRRFEKQNSHPAGSGADESSCSSPKYFTLVINAHGCKLFVG